MTPIHGTAPVLAGKPVGWTIAERVDLAAATAFLASSCPAHSTVASGASSLTCPHCGSDDVQGWGHCRAGQRHRCKRCGKTFSPTTGAPWAYSKYPEKWLEMAWCIIQCAPVRRTADRLGIHPCTAFRWRHRLLDALANRRPTPVLSGIIEVTEYFYPAHRRDELNLVRSLRERRLSLYEPYHNDPHYCIIFAQDRQGHTLTELAGLGTPSVDALDKVLGHAITPGSEICSFSRYWYKQFCLHTGLQHHEVKHSDQLDIMCNITSRLTDPTASIHVYNVTRALTYRNRFQRWINRFMGVAPKYLSRYLAWSELLDRMGYRLA